MFNVRNYHQVDNTPLNTTNQSNYCKAKYTPSYYSYTQPDRKTLNRGMSQTIVQRSNLLINDPMSKYADRQSLQDQILSPGDSIQDFNSKPLYSPSPNANPYYYNNKSVNTFIKPSDSALKDSLSLLPHATRSKKTLVLDLDETLVHSAFKPFFFKADLMLNINVDNANHIVYVLKRPHCDEFLEKMAQHYEIVVFTASISQYANAVLDQLDKNHLISHRLWRDHCVYSNGLYIKDLKRLGRNLKDTLIVDNNPISYALNQDNGVPILTWHYDKTDTELLKLIPFLESLAYVDDVRDYIKNCVSNHTVNYACLNQLIHKQSPSMTPLYQNTDSNNHQQQQQQLHFYQKSNQMQIENKNSNEAKCSKCNCRIENTAPASMYGKFNTSSPTPFVNNSGIYHMRERELIQSKDPYEDKHLYKASNNPMSHTPGLGIQSTQKDNLSHNGLNSDYFNARYGPFKNDSDIKDYYASEDREREFNGYPHHLTNNEFDLIDQSSKKDLAKDNYSQNDLYNSVPKERALLNKSLEDKYYAETGLNVIKANRENEDFAYHTPIQIKTPFHQYSQLATNNTKEDYNSYQIRTQHFPSNIAPTDFNSYFKDNLTNSKDYPFYRNYHLNKQEKEVSLNTGNTRGNYHMRNEADYNNVTDKAKPSYSINNYMLHASTNTSKEYYPNQNSENEYKRGHQYPSLQEQTNQNQSNYYQQQQLMKQLPSYYAKNSFQENTIENKGSSSFALKTPERNYYQVLKEDSVPQQPPFQIERDTKGSKSVDRVKHYDSPIYHQYYRGNAKDIPQGQPMFLQERENNLSFTRVPSEYNQPKQSQPQFREYIPYKRVFGHIQKK